MIVSQSGSVGIHPAGTIEAQLDRVGQQMMAGWRLVLAALGALAFAAAPADGRMTVAAVVTLVLAWSGPYVRALWVGPAAWLIWIDLVVVVLVCLSQSSIVPASHVENAQGWVLALASVSAIAYQWHSRTLAGTVSGLVVCAAFMLGAHLAAPGRWGALA